MNTSQPSSLQVKGVTLQSTAGNTIITLTGNIRKCWTLRKTRKREPSRRQSTQKKTNAKQRKQLPKVRHHETEPTKVRTSMVPYRSTTKVNQSETTLKYFDPLRTHKYHPHIHIHTHYTTHTHTHTHTLERSEMMQNMEINNRKQGT